MNEPDAITDNLALRWKQQRVNVLPGVTARGMATLIDSFDRGYLRQFALACDEMIERDETLTVAVPKMKRRVARCRWEVVIGEEVPEGLQARAEEQQTVLKRFYSTLSYENATERNEKGGLRAVIRRCMNAPLMRFAVHRILWKPTPEGMTATLRHVPLAFFDNTSGELRWAGVEGTTPGKELDDPQNWLIAVSDTCLMKALSICYLFKRLPLQDALNFCQRFGIPTVHGETNAAYGSTEWNNFVAALRDFANSGVIATTLGDKINILENTAANGEQVFGWIIESMKRAMVTICTGSDLATMSRENGAGASLQNDEADEMTADFCEWLSETFNEQLDRRVIEDAFGEGEELLAYFKLLPPSELDAEREMKIDDHVSKYGVYLSVDDVAERFGRTHDAEAAQADGQDAADAGNEAGGKVLQRIRSGAAQAFRAGVRRDLEPLAAALKPLVHAEGASESRNAAASLNLNFASLEEAVLNGNAATTAMQTALAVELLQGLAANEGGDAEAANARGGGMRRAAKIGNTVSKRGRFEEDKHPRGAGGKFADKPGAGDDAPSKSDKAKQNAVRVGREEQQYADELERDVAKGLGGVSFKDSEPVDVVVGKSGVIEHGVEFKAVISGKNDKLTMNTYAQIRKVDWEKRNKSVFHTVVRDVRNGRDVYFYRRGIAGSARLGSLHEAKSIGEVKKLMLLKEKDLPAAARRTDKHLTSGRWKFFEDAEGKGYRDLKTGTVHRAKK